MGIEKLRKHQIGLEETAGTAVAATRMLRGKANFIRDTSAKVRPEENIGILANTSRTYTPSRAATYSQPEQELTFEELPYLLACGVQNTEDGVATGGTTDGYVYTYAIPNTTANTIKTATIEAGDDAQAYEMEYAFVKSFTIRGAPGEALRYSVEWVGRQRSKTTFTSLTPPAVEEILFGKSALYIDALAGTWGNTAKANTFLGFEMTIDTGWREVFTGDGNLYFSFIKCVGLTGTLRVMYEHDAIAVSEDDAWVTPAARQVRINIPGSALTGTGGSFATKLFRADLVCVPASEPGVISVRDGNDIMELTYDIVYDATATDLDSGAGVNKVGVFTVVNKLSAL